MESLAKQLILVGCGAAIGTSLVIFYRGYSKPTPKLEDPKSRSEAISKLLHSVSISQSEREGFVHRGVTCDRCKTCPIRGIRFKCLNCNDYDVCEACESQDQHNLTHVFIQIKIPIPALICPRVRLFPPLYPTNSTIVTSNVRPLNDKEIKVFVDQTHFDAFEVKGMWEQFLRLSTHIKEGEISKLIITRDCFINCIGNLANKRNLITERIFHFFDGDGDGEISFLDFIKGMSILCKGSQIEKIECAFRGFDIENNGYLTKDSFNVIFEAYFSLSIHQIKTTVQHLGEEMASNFNEEAGRPISAMFTTPIPNLTTTTISRSKGMVDKTDMSKGELTEGMFNEAISQLVDVNFATADTDHDGRISLPEFKIWASSDPTIILWFNALGTVF